MKKIIGSMVALVLISGAGILLLGPLTSIPKERGLYAIPLMAEIICIAGVVIATCELIIGIRGKKKDGGLTKKEYHAAIQELSERPGIGDIDPDSIFSKERC